MTGWKTPFDDPIPLPAGGELRTFRDAADYIRRKVSKADQAKPHWQLAGKMLIAAAEGRDFNMHARIAMLQAIHHGAPDPKRPRERKSAKKFKLIR